MHVNSFIISLILIPHYGIFTNNIFNTSDHDLVKKEIEEIKKNMSKNIWNEIMDEKMKKLNESIKELKEYLQRQKCSSWNDRFINSIFEIGYGVRSEKSKGPNKHSTHKMPKPILTNVKDVDRNQVLGNWFINMRNYFVGGLHLQDPHFIEVNFEKLNTSVNDGLLCNPGHLHKLLPPEQLDRLKNVLMQHFSSRRPSENPKLVPRGRAKRKALRTVQEIFNTRLNIYNLLLESEILREIILQ